MKAFAVLWLIAGTAHADVEVADEIEAVPGAQVAVSLTLSPGAGRTIGPLRIELASTSLTLPRTRYRNKHAADPDAAAPRFDLEIVAPTAGDHELAIDVRYWECRRKTCRPLRFARTVVVRAAVESPVAPSSP